MKNKIKVLTTKDRTEWSRLVEGTNRPDIYFTPEYAKIYEYNYTDEINENFCGISNLFFFGNDEEYIIYPIIKRKIKNLPFVKEKKSYSIFDISSHYGYGGPLIKCKYEQNENKLLEKFMIQFKEYCKDNKIITEFIRFHPLLKNHQFCKKYFPIQEKNETVFIDLTKKKNVLFKELNKKTRNLIRKAQKKDVKISISKNKNDLIKFTQLYLDTMLKNKSSKKYLLPLQFFENTINLLKENISLFVAKKEDKIISAALFIHKYEFIHYHFSGSDKEYLNLAPNNLLIWEVILWAKKQGYKKFHLGGGLLNKDPLFHFKAGFSKDRSKFYTANKVYDENILSYKKNLKLVIISFAFLCVVLIFI